MRLKLAEQEDMTKDHHIRQKIRERQAEVDRLLAELGAETIEVAEATPYAFRYRLRYAGDTRQLAADIEQIEGAEVLSFGSALELIKDLGDATRVSEQYGLGTFRGTHGIGHTRMATESDVDIRSAHPYWAYPYNDIAVVHNGQITNYWIMRREMERLGHRFMSNCDSELLAVYTANNLEQGATLEDSLKASIKEIDGVFTYVVATENELGMAKDTMAAKPMVLFESDDLVALASEEVAIRAIVPHEIDTSDPYDEEVRVWQTLTRGELSAQELLSHEMGLHTEKLGGRTQQALLRHRSERGASRLLAAIRLRRRLQQARRDRRLQHGAENRQSAHPRADAGRLRHHRHQESGRQAFARRRHSQSAQSHHRRLARLFRARPDRRTECAHRRPRRLVVRREHDERAPILIEKNAGSQFGAAIRGGDLVCKGDVGSRTGIDMKGGTIIVGGDTGAFTGFMMQRGRMVICGNAGKNLGDSMYDGTIYIGGEPASLGVDAVWGEMTDLDRAWLARKLKLYDLVPKGGVGGFRKIVAGKQLWNYDNLEPTEKKLVL